MKIGAVEIKGFRNLAPLNLEELGRVNLIVGRNAQGKTNLLEAVASTVLGGSFRIASDRAVVGYEESATYVRARMVGDNGGESDVLVAWAQLPDGRMKKQIKLNGAVVRPGVLSKHCPGVIFSPEDIDLLRLSPSYRRRFMDGALSSADAEYEQLLAEYTRVLKQRNQILLSVMQGREQVEALDIWDAQLARSGSAIVGKRQQFVKDLSQWVTQLYKQLFVGQARDVLKVVYVPSLAYDYEGHFRERLAGLRNLDIVRATTTRGIHRDDLAFLLDGKDVRTTASRGEFRSIVIALKLAEGRTLAGKLTETPIYFLDDVLSELDEKRRQAIAKELLGAQVWMTTSDMTAARLFEDLQVMAVERGGVQMEMPVKES